MKEDSHSSQLKPFSLNKHNAIFVKFVVVFLLLGLAIRLFSSHSVDYSSSILESQPPLAIDSQVSLFINASNDHQGSFNLSSTAVFKNESKQKCDLLKGDWVPNPSGPAYNNNSCHIIEDHQNCMMNGRPDSGYLYWRWSPRDCELPRFDSKRFLDLMRNKSWAFIGDSISRNHVQSMVCTLSQVDPAREIYHDEQFKSKKWIFPSYNFTVSVIWSPFLVKAEIFEDNDGVSTAETHLHLDKLDEEWISQYKDFDYAIIAGGKWFLKTAIYYENNTVLGCHYCPGRNLTELGSDYAYRKVLQLVFNFVLSSSHKALVFFRTITPDHFENGEWSTGGTCERKLPIKEGEMNITDIDRELHEVELQEFEKAVGSVVGSEKGVAVLKLLNTTSLSLLRPDGHPGPYRQFRPFDKDKNAKVQTDCLHWCLPGPIDSWNDLVMEMLVNH